MPDPGTVFREQAEHARKVLGELTDEELKTYQTAVEAIAKNERLFRADEAISGYNARGALQRIEEVVAQRKTAKQYQ